ncbi:ANTAR domain-containing protein [Streptomyces sp. NPDC058279]|uniref:ANTAR domain-containing protein n=1 Tax=Streptomyces sp. NPDC058279 TaxID=3346418 RepID=UPI0036E2E3CA
MISVDMARVLGRLRRRDGPGGVESVITAATEILGVDGLAVSLSAEDEAIELMWCTDEDTRRFEDLQFTLGEGPGPDAVRRGVMVWAPDLIGGRSDRWPALASEAEASAVFCFPMGVGAIRVGVLTALRRTPGSLTSSETDDALALAGALTAHCLEDGAPHDACEHAGFPGALGRAVVHQATGMLSVQLSLPLPKALLRLRAHAYGSGRSLTDTAQDIVDRRLRLAPDGPPPTVADKDGLP